LQNFVSTLSSTTHLSATLVAGWSWNHHVWSIKSDIR